MVKGNFLKFFKNKGFYLAIGVCALAIVAVAGVVNYQSKQQDKQLAENAAGFEDVPEGADNDQNAVADNRTQDNDYDMDYTEGYNADEVQNILNDIQEQAAAAQSDAVAANSGDVDAAGDNGSESGAAQDNSQAADDAAQSTIAQFDDTQKMSWPVQGTILLDYSMDTTTYYKTLDQYKCNPGVLIATESNTPVNAAFEGTVASITNDAALGTVLTIDMGNGYQAIYGQLKDVAVSVGDSVAAGELLGSVAQPTKYFIEEGTHLYFQMTKDGQPIDPKPYME